MTQGQDPTESMGPADGLDSTANLLLRIRSGDADAREALIRRFLPVLTRWAHGKAPLMLRGGIDTDDLVQITLLRALKKVDVFEPRGVGAFLSYLRQTLKHEMIDQLRKEGRNPAQGGVVTNEPDPGPSPYRQVVGRETWERYRTALSRLSEQKQEAVVLRVEWEFTYDEIARTVGFPTANAARMCVTRALVELAEAMDV